MIRHAILLAAAMAVSASVARAEPRVTIISQWSAGAEGAAINAVGELVEKNGAKWQHSPVAGFTTDMMNKLRADIIAGRPPAASQLKGPEIREWSKISPARDLDKLVAAANFAAVIPPDLAALHKPRGHWIALPMQVYRVNTMFASKKALDRIGATEMPKTWDEFNAMAEKMRAAGIATPLMHGGTRSNDTMYFELVLATMNPDAYRHAIMELDDKALRGPEVLAALRQLRRMTTWMSPSNAGQHFSVFLPAVMKGEYGFFFNGGWASGVLKKGGFEEGRDYLCGTMPTNSSKPVFDLNADGVIFWETKDPDLTAGQTVLANTVMSKEFSTVFSQINGSLPARTDMTVEGEGFQPCQRDAAANLAGAQKADQVLLSLGHNMAQTNPVTSALTDVLTEFVHDPSVTPEKAQERLAEAADGVR
ncbi:MAG: ABC transporter substrate-binding protein [Ramlibacter sp.]